MQKMLCALAVAAAGCVPLAGSAEASSLTATYIGGTFLTGPNFDIGGDFKAVFYYNPDDLVQTSATSFDGSDASKGQQYAVLTTDGKTQTFYSTDYFYETVISGSQPDYKFGIGQADGSFLYLKLNGATQEGNYVASDGSGSDLYPTSVTIAPAKTTVSPVPLPPTFALFGGSLLVLGAAALAKSRGKAKPSNPVMAAA